MKQVDKDARRGYGELDFNTPTIVGIPGTRRAVKMTGIHPYTISALTRLWIARERDNTPTDSAETLKSMCEEPYFTIKEACLLVLNSWWKIKFIYPFKWRIWAFIHQYTEEQMLPLIVEGKKKLPLTAHWMNMAYSTDMREDWMKMTQKEADQYRAELLSAVKPLLSKNTPVTEGSGGE